MDDLNRTLGKTGQTPEEPLDDAVQKRLMDKISSQKPIIPQRPYCQGNPIPPGAVLQNIFFATTDGEDFPAVLALAGRNNLLVDGESTIFTDQVRTINLRIEWPGYDGWEAQIRTVNYQDPPKPITRARLVTEIAKQLVRFIEIKQSVDIDPDQTMYKVGQEGFELRHIYIASLEQVSRGSWQPRLTYSGL